MASVVQISESEWDVMEPIWQDGPLMAADVIKRLKDTHDWNHSTIRTLLARLVEKKVLDYEVDGSKYVYRAIVSREQCVRRKGRSFLEKTFGGDVTALVAHFISEASLDPEQIKRIRELLDRKKKDSGKQK